MAQHNRNNWHHIPGIGGIMATGLSINQLLVNFSKQNIKKGLHSSHKCNITGY